ncbi:B-lymphocyte antigen CD20 [Triplophysa dalaica]|uniref:B-lymphocyte antigen CD20 n=1 Tax=Triplophysa dalaica TaxID=1582913 RepID=UPI0024E03349|nr:B-lymphocyte antigen CD20 [Triplophysa dalaica]
MRYTFKPDDCMVITIPLGSLRNVGDGQLMPEKFTCVFKDAYKVFLRGRPKELGVAQFFIGVFIICVGVLIPHRHYSPILFFTLPSALFIVGGVLTCAAGSSPIMPVVKLSFIFNILSLFWALIGLVFCTMTLGGIRYYSEPEEHNMYSGLTVVVCVLHGVELILALVLLFWGSKAVCRPHFNTLPLITIKQDE